MSKLGRLNVYYKLVVGSLDNRLVERLEVERALDSLVGIAAEQRIGAVPGGGEHIPELLVRFSAQALDA